MRESNRTERERELYRTGRERESVLIGREIGKRVLHITQRGSYSAIEQ